MPRTYRTNQEQAKELEAARKDITDKRVDKRLHAVQLRGQGIAFRAAFKGRRYCRQPFGICASPGGATPKEH